MLRLEKISRRYPGANRAVLDNLSVDFRAGRITVVMGASGAGKSTLINCILQADRPDAGCILCDGKPMEPERVDPTLISGMMQAPALFQHMTVLENLTLAPRVVLKQNAAEANRDALAVLNRLGILEKAYAYPAALSGGEAQRVALARAMMMKPRVLVLDEPTSALNEDWVLQLADILKSLKSQGTTIILSTHHVAFARAVADDLFLLADGHVTPVADLPSELEAGRAGGASGPGGSCAGSFVSQSP